ncbi:MAG: DeoR/GlpR family DNA-binding transcription regulator [Tissierellia bacterium]|nr:DeoR/GlpR family DNA-binding transcription regulator [Tissierellia bacterium]
MLKVERQNLIESEIKKTGIIRVSEITSRLNVTEMTIRRDLKELEEKGVLKRIHGGAKALDEFSLKEYSHNEKRLKNIDEKKYIAKLIADNIQTDETVFLGPGTTIELVADYIKDKRLRIITTSFYLFDKLAYNDYPEIILVGGYFRHNTGAFVGNFANSTLSDIRVKKSFIGVNGISDNECFTSSEEEGETQKIILDNSKYKFLVADNTKIGREDFYNFYSLDETTAVFCDDNLTKTNYEKLSKYTKVITK